MIQRVLVGCVLWLTASTIPAQYFLTIGSEPRRLTRATWVGRSGQQSVTLEYGQPKWRPEYEQALQERSAAPFLLGNGGLTTLRTDVDLAFGTQKLARGRWYVGARRDDKAQWSLALFAADRVDASGRGTAAVGTEPDLLVPVKLVREGEPVELFEATLTDTKRTPHNLALTMLWGPFRLRTELTAAFDNRKPAGAPEFALTAAVKGTQTASGLIYETLRAGAGERPDADDMLQVHYAGWLTDGTLFDSSHLRDEPSPWTSQWVVKGLAEGLQLMQPGATFRMTIPPDLAYGDRGAGDRVPPGATLVFTVTLHNIDKR